MKTEDQLEVEAPVLSELEQPESETTDATESIDLPEFKAPLEKKFIKNLTDFGNYVDFVGGAREDNLKMHPYAYPRGGFVLADEDNVVPKSIREMSKKVLGSLLKGQIHDITRTPTPAYLHHYISHLGLCKNDMT